MNKKPQIGIIMGSDSDLPIMQAAADCLHHFSIAYELTIVSAHRTPDRLADYAKTAYQRGLSIIIAGAGGAAHLPGMVASYTALPVIGVPILSRNSLSGIDSLLSIVQMPNGIPVATVAVGAAENAALLAVRMLAIHDKDLYEKLTTYQKSLTQKVRDKAEALTARYSCDYQEKIETL